MQQGELWNSDRYRLLVDSIADYAIYMLDREGHVASWNRGAERISHYKEAEVIGRHFSQFYTPEDRQAGLPQQALELARNEGRFETEGWRIRKDNSRFWAHVVIDPIRGADGSVIGFAKIACDLSKRKQAEEILRRSQEQFQLLVQGVTDYAIFLLDPAGNVVSWNAGAERIKGYRADEIIGQHFSRFYIEKDAAAGLPQEALATALRAGKYEREALRRRKDGSVFWAHVVIDPIYNADGTHAGFAKITRDVTERRRAEEALAEARDRLLQSQKIESIGQLTGGIAHDFNNLLTAVLGSLEILRKRLPSDPRFLKPLDNAIAGAQRGAGLTQRLLAFARKQELKFEAVDVIGLVQGMTELLQSSTGLGVRVETKFPLRLSPAHTDANQLELAILNLVLNARDAMPGGGEITICASEQALPDGNALELLPGDYVCLCVIDRGEGMDAETLARAVEPFFTTKGIGRGTGLGLPMVHGMAAQSGGRLLLKSRKGEGTTAELWLPRAAADSRVQTTAAKKPGTTAVMPANLTILVVDDDPLVLRNTSVALEDLGHAVVEAGSAREALAILGSRDDIGLIVVDQIMPEMTGTEFAALVARERPALPILLASAYTDLPERVQLPRLHKPFTQADLMRAIDTVVGPSANKRAPRLRAAVTFETSLDAERKR